MPTQALSRHQALARLALLLGVSAGCSRSDADRLDAPRVSLSPAAVTDADGRCHDVGAFRVCWSARCPEGVCTTPRPLPAALDQLPLDVRCTGEGKARRCRPRGESSSPFRCREHRCVQELPRMPDDGEWECSDLSGLVLCRGGMAPAGLAGVNADPGWICGQRRHGKPNERVCLDLDPDLPSLESSARTCRYEILGARSRRICEARGGTRFGDPCSRNEVCPIGGSCVHGVCLPPRVTPDCWSDFDCGQGRCSFGSCGASPT